MTEFCCDHTFRITISASKFEALVAQACRSQFQIELIGHDPTLVPQLRLFDVLFSTPEDRDRVRIAMRFLEKEQAAMAPARAQPVTGKLATA
jgi:hypothetical protein